MLELSKLTNGKPLSTLAEHLLRTSGLTATFQLDTPKLERFLATIEAGYSNEVPYHNKAHAASVLHMTHALMLHGGVAAIVGSGQHFYKPGSIGSETAATAELYPPGSLESLACMFAAIVHDFEHLGLNNGFLVATQHPRALRYNDMHVNESHHVAAAFEVLLLEPDCNFLSALPPAVFAAFRKLVVALVGATDMAVDKEIVNNFSQLVATAKLQAADKNQMTSAGIGDANMASNKVAAAEAPFVFMPSCEKEAVAALQLVLKAADLGHLALPWDQHVGWVQALEAELFLQGDTETALGKPTSFLCDRNAPGVTQSQVGFFNFVVNPLYDALESAFPATNPMVEQVAANGAAWKAKSTANSD